jgi:hypothetical protein
VKAYVKRIEKQWVGENPQASKKALEYLEMSLLIAEATMPLYFQYWSKDIKGMKWKSLEGEFKVPFKLKDGRETFLRGKRDGGQVQDQDRVYAR